MTERKSFKKIVRTRMAKTGESYSTAHRHVAAAGRTLPAGVVPAYPGFGSDQHHESSVVQHLLAQAGLPLSEPMTCGLGGGIGFLYAVFSYVQAPHPVLTIVAQHHPQPWAEAVLTHLGIPYSQAHSTSTAAALTKLRRELDGGRPVLCTVDRYALPWHGTGSEMSGADPYVVVVAGRDGDTLYVDDDAPSAHALPAEEFGRAWSGHRKGRHHMLTVDAVGRVDLAGAVRAALGTTVAHLTGPVLGNSFDVNMGLSGMAKLATELREPRAKSAWIRRFDTPAGYAHALARLEECLQREYTAPAATRPLYAAFLAEAGPLVPDLPLAEAAGLIRRSGNSWATLTSEAARSAAVSAGALPDVAERQALFEELADLVEACLATERQAVTLLTPTAAPA